jgi:hypothetical protein
MFDARFSVLQSYSHATRPEASLKLMSPLREGSSEETDSENCMLVIPAIARWALRVSFKAEDPLKSKSTYLLLSLVILRPLAG